MINEKKLKRMLWLMRIRKIVCPFTLNKSAKVDYYYHRFISEIGYDKWKYYEPDIKSAWNSASRSFGKMYGLIKAWSKTGLPLLDEKRKEIYEKECKYNYELKLHELDEKISAIEDKKAAELADKNNKLEMAKLDAQIDKETFISESFKNGNQDIVKILLEK
ncbi:MAG: hypothetical protein NC122_09515 [Faecalibacterium sp.]|nr:hypothetical protein [Ruminococcus sp.]MCM1392533.1 hypothetical protein [Ruminococcus sp.]MCM1486429.1 hypothetical protein [Faecalibacterium sp.]